MMKTSGCRKAQSLIEFTAGMVILCLIMYGMVEVFRWGMMDLAERRYDHDKSLVANVSVEDQLKPNFHQTRPMDTLWYKKAPNP